MVLSLRRTLFEIEPRIFDCAVEALEKSDCIFEQMGFDYYCDAQISACMNRNASADRETWEQVKEFSAIVSQYPLCLITSRGQYFDRDLQPVDHKSDLSAYDLITFNPTP